ncbi:hypothetical protein [Campylobacter sp. 19-13652]|uniref:hypothetical protein n=1 Tax=Campylobacter sp. 19-13652 TaxID=2840180 RepID=UPI001C76EBCA|nr:hypothetical protein [Campylobacter sp. 19-13652]BCX79819.1 hypothetical protein LBC_12810 [Campylobacter sp. 19-13652]
MNSSEVVFTKLAKSTCVFSDKKALSDDEILAIVYKNLKLSPDKDYVTGHILTTLENGSLIQVFAAEKSHIKKLAKDKNAKVVFPFWAVYEAPGGGTCCLISEYEGEKFIACYLNTKLIASFLIDEISWQSASIKINEITKDYGIFFNEIYTTEAKLGEYFTFVSGVMASSKELGFASLYTPQERFDIKRKLAFSAILGVILGIIVTTCEYFSHEYSKNLSNLKLNRSILISEQAKLKDLALKIDDLRAQKESLIKSQELPSLDIASKSDKSKVLEKLIALAKRAGVKISSISVNRQTLTLIATSSEYVKISSFITLILDDFVIISAKNEALDNGFEVSIKARKKYAR